MTSTYDGKGVKSNQTSGQKGKSYFIELYKSLEAGLSSDCELRQRTQHLCEAWRRIHSLCQHSASSTHPHLLSWLQRHTAKTVLQTEWQSPGSKDEHARLEEAINGFVQESHNAIANRNGESPPWESQLVQRGEWFKRILSSPWGHPVLKKLLDTRGEPPGDEEILEWLKEERGVMFVTRLRQLAASKCDDLAMALASAVLDRVRADVELVTDAEQAEEPIDKPKKDVAAPTFADILKTEAGFTVDVWELLTDIEFVLLHKSDKRSRCIELAKQTPLRNGYQLVERLQSRLETSPREKKLWKNAKEVATLIAQVVIARCMVVPGCAGASRSALYCCTRSLVRLVARARLPAAAAALAAPARTATHLHTLAAAVHAQSTEDMKPFVCELYVRAITAGMNELERLKLKTEKESQARAAEQILAAWFQQLGLLLQNSDRIKCECILTAFSVHPSPAMYERIKAAPLLPPVAMVKEEIKQETLSEFGSWASDSRSQTNFVKTSETLNLKQTQHQANVLSTAILTEGERLGLGAELCQDIAVLLSNPRVKTLSWDMDRELLLENCRAYMERTDGGTRALTTELKYLNLDPKAFQHLPEEQDDENDAFYGIEKGYEHLVEFQEPEEIWQDAVVDYEETETSYSSCTEADITTAKVKKKTRRLIHSSDEDSDPLSLVAEAKRNHKKKERPHSKERSKERIKKKSSPDPLETKEHSQERRKKKSRNKEKKKEKRERKKKEKSKPSSLSHLVGMKITKVGRHILTTSVTDSDYDSQGKSSLNSLNSEGNEDVLFDGLYSMDELKSPERNSHSDRMGLLKNNEFSVSDGAIAINKGHMNSNNGNDNVRNISNTVPKSPSSDLRSNIDCASASKIPSVLHPSYKNVTNEVKKSITRLIEFRRQKNAMGVITENKSYLATPIASSTCNMPRAIIRPDSPFQSQIIPKAVAIPEIPKVYINKHQSQNLAEINTELNHFINENNTLHTPQPVIQNAKRIFSSKVSQSKSSINLTTPTTVAEITKASQNKYLMQQNSVKTANNNPLRPNHNMHTNSNDLVPKSVNSMDTDQKNYQNFLKELQQSINAGAGVNACDKLLPNQSAIVKKEIKPISRVTPVVPATNKAETKFSQCAKQLVHQYKSENSLNTFSRLSYMHKNKQNEAKMKQVVDMLKKLQDSNIRKCPIKTELDRIASEHNELKMKYLKNKDEVSISKIDRTAPVSIFNESAQVMITKVEKPSKRVLIKNEYPVPANVLQPNVTNQPKYHAIKHEMQSKSVLSERLHNMTTPCSTSSLSETDHSELLLLLRQKNKLNASYSPIRIPNTREDVCNGQVPKSFITSNNGPNIPIAKSNTLLPQTLDKEAHKNKTLHMNYTNPVVTMASNLQSKGEVEVKPTLPKTANVIKTDQNQINNGDSEQINGNNTGKNTDGVIFSKQDMKPVTTSQISTSTDWEVVMNAIRAQNTPSRGPKALDVALNKNSFAKAFSDSLRDQNMIKTTSLIKFDSLEFAVDTNELNVCPTSSTLTAAHVRKSCHSGKPKRHTTKNETVARCKPVVKANKSRNTSNISEVSNNNTKLATPMQSVLYIPKRQQHSTEITKSNRIEASKKVIEHQKNNISCALLKQNDPFISGIANSDYDLLEELIDDDLRQEIGELSSDDDNTSIQTIPKVTKNDVPDKCVGNIPNKANNISTVNKISVDLHTGHNPCEVKKKVMQKPILKRDNNAVKTYSLQIQHTSGAMNVVKARNDPTSANKMPNNTEVEVANELHIMTPKVVENSKKYTKQSLNPNNATTIKPSNVFVSDVPQETFQSVVLIGSNLIYDSYPAMQTQMHAGISNLRQNTFVAVNNAPNIALYQTTQFVGPAVNPVIVGNAITTPISVTTASSSTVTVPHNKIQSTTIMQRELNKATNQIIQTNASIVQNDLNRYKINPVIQQHSLHKYINPGIERETNLEFSLNKNVERKILSQVQEKQKQICDSKILRNQILSLEHTMKKDTLKDQERLKKKRMSIINRKINHRCDNAPIPLTYTPLLACSGTDLIEQIQSESENEIITSSDHMKKVTKLETLSNFKDQKCEKDLTKVDEATTLEGNENCKENKNNFIQCRRILLRSSNKFKGKAISSNEIPKAPSGRKTKVRLKETTPEVKDIVTDKDKKEKAVLLSGRRVSKRISRKTLTKVRTEKKRTEGKKKIQKQEKRIVASKITEINGECKGPVIDALDDIEDALLCSKIQKNISDLTLNATAAVLNISSEGQEPGIQLPVPAGIEHTREQSESKEPKSIVADKILYLGDKSVFHDESHVNNKKNKTSVDTESLNLSHIKLTQERLTEKEESVFNAASSNSNKETPSRKLNQFNVFAKVTKSLICENEQEDRQTTIISADDVSKGMNELLVSKPDNVMMFKTTKKEEVTTSASYKPADDLTASLIFGNKKVTEFITSNPADDITIPLISQNKNVTESKPADVKATSLLLDNKEINLSMPSDDSTISLTSDIEEEIEFKSVDDSTILLVSKKEEEIESKPAYDHTISKNEEEIESKLAYDHKTFLMTKNKESNESILSETTDHSTISLISKNEENIESKLANGLADSLISENEQVKDSKFANDLMANIISEDEEVTISAPSEPLTDIRASVSEAKDGNEPTPCKTVDALTTVSVCEKKQLIKSATSKPAVDLSAPLKPEDILLSGFTSLNSAGEIIPSLSCKKQEQMTDFTNKSFSKTGNIVDSKFRDNSMVVKVTVPATSDTTISNKYTLSIESLSENPSTLEKQSGAKSFVHKVEIVQSKQAMAKAQVIKGKDKKICSKIINSKKISHQAHEQLINYESEITYENRPIDVSGADLIRPANDDYIFHRTSSDNLSEVDKIKKIQESYTHSVKIDHLPNISNDALKRGFSKLSSGHGKIHNNFDTFVQPSMNSMLLDSFTNKKMHTLNVKQTPIMTSVNPDKILETPIVAPNKVSDRVETINLISDEEDDDRSKHFKTEFGTYKVRSANNVTYLEHQKKLNLRCRVKLIDIKSDSAIANLEETDMHRDACKTNLQSTEVPNDCLLDILEFCDFERKTQKTLQEVNRITATVVDTDRDIIVIDDSSNDSVIIENIPKPIPQENEFLKPKDTINELKDLLLKDLGMQNIVNDNIVLNNCHDGIQGNETYSNSDITEQNDAGLNEIYDSCFVKVRKCDDLVKKYENMQIIKRKCFVELVRCDDVIDLYSRQSEKSNFQGETDMVVLETEETVRKRTMLLSRSGSLTILNAFPTSDDDSIPPICIKKHGRTSPVIDAFETIASFRNKNNEKYEQPKTQQRSENEEYYTCECNWLMTKRMLHSQNTACKMELVNNYTANENNDYDVTAVSLNNIRSEPTDTLEVPSLTKLMSIYFQNNTIINQLTCFNGHGSHYSSQAMKRKLIVRDHTVGSKISKIRLMTATPSHSQSTYMSDNSCKIDNLPIINSSNYTHDEMTRPENMFKSNTAFSEEIEIHRVHKYCELVQDESPKKKDTTQDQTAIKLLATEIDEKCDTPQALDVNKEIIHNCVQHCAHTVNESKMKSDSDNVLSRVLEVKRNVTESKKFTDLQKSEKTCVHIINSFHNERNDSLQKVHEKNTGEEELLVKNYELGQVDLTKKNEIQDQPATKLSTTQIRQERYTTQAQDIFKETDHNYVQDSKSTKSDSTIESDCDNTFCSDLKYCNMELGQSKVDDVREELRIGNTIVCNITKSKILNESVQNVALAENNKSKLIQKNSNVEVTTPLPKTQNNSYCSENETTNFVFSEKGINREFESEQKNNLAKDWDKHNLQLYDNTLDKNYSNLKTIKNLIAPEKALHKEDLVAVDKKCLANCLHLDSTNNLVIKDVIVNTEPLQNDRIMNNNNDKLFKNNDDFENNKCDETVPVEILKSNQGVKIWDHDHITACITSKSEEKIEDIKCEPRDAAHENEMSRILTSDINTDELSEVIIDVHGEGNIYEKNVVSSSSVSKYKISPEYEKSTINLEDCSGVVLKGIEYQDPIVGTCYVFSVIKSADTSENDSDALNDSTEEVVQIIEEICEGRAIEAIDPEDENFKVIVPKVTYSTRCPKAEIVPKFSEKKSKKYLKRKIDMSDIKIYEKKYRKGKNIDYPKFTIASLNDTVYSKEYKRLLDYCSSVTFSYSRPFHKEYIDAHNLLKEWPLSNSNVSENMTKIESCKTLFIDIEDPDKLKAIADPMKQTLAEELISEYNETHYSSIEIDETNFNMGFGEGSGRVIQNLKGGDVSKFSAATLSDVKQSQPFLLSEDYDDRIKKISRNDSDQIEKLRRYITYIQLRDKVRTFFRKTTVELNLLQKHEKYKDLKFQSIHCNDTNHFPFGLTSLEFIEPFPIEAVVQVVQVGQLPVSAAAQNPVTCDPRVTQVSDASPSQCSAENSPHDDPQSAIKTEYTVLTTANMTLPMVQDYAQHNQAINLESQDTSNMTISDENIPIRTEIKSVVKIELMEELPESKEQNEVCENNASEVINNHIINNVDYSFDTSTNTSLESDSHIQIIYNSVEKQNSAPETYSHQKQENGSLEKTDQIAHAMNAAGIATTAETITSTRAHALVNILSQKIRQSAVGTTQSTTNNYSKPTSINALALQQALAQLLPPPLNQTNVTDNNQQCSNSPQVLHIVQGKSASGNQITLVDNSQQSVINTPNATPVLHIVQNKGAAANVTSNGTPAAQSNSFIVDSGLQQGGNQLLHIVNTGNQKNNTAGQIIKRVNLLTNLANVQGSNEQKMVQFVCKSADGKAIQLNAPHQRSMVLRLQPVESPNIQSNPPKPVETQDLSPTSSAANSVTNKEIVTSQHEIKSRSVYEENYAKFIQNSSTKQAAPEKSTSLPKFNQVFGKQVFQDGSQKQNELNSHNHHMPSLNSNTENAECQPAENTINLEHISQISSPPLLLRKSPAQTSQPQQNLVQQIKQTIAPMNLHSMHGGVIYTRQIPVNIGAGQTINLITVPSTELIDDSAQKQQSDVKYVNHGDIEPSIIKIVPQSQPAPNAEVPQEDNNSHVVSNETTHNPQPQPVLTQMRIKLPMLSKTPQMVSGARVVRPSFFQIQRNVIGGANQPVYQQLVLTAAPPIGQQTIRLPHINPQTNRPLKVPTESQSSAESQMSSSTLEQLREFDLVLEQVKERSTVQPNTNSTNAFSKLNTTSTDTTDGPGIASSTSTESTQQVFYSIGNNQPLNVTYVNRKATVTTPTTSTYVRSPDSSGIADSPTSSHVQIPHTVTSDSPSNETPAQTKPTKVSSKSKSRPKASSNPPNTLKLNTVPPKTSAQKPLEDEQTTQRILYILAEYKEQVENSPDKDKPAPRRRSNPPSNPSGSSKRKKSSSSSRRSGVRDMSPVHGDDTCRTMGSEDSSCGTSQGDCNESCLDSHSPQDSPRKVVRKLTFEQENSVSQPRPQPQRNVIVADGQTITVARGTAGKPATAVLMPANYILPVSMVKGGQQIAIVTNRGPKLLTVGGGEGGATNALLLQRLIGPAGLKPVLTRPGVRHVRLPTAALHNLQAFNLATATTVQPPDSTASPAPAPTPELVETRASTSPWTDRESQEVKPERGSSPDGSEPWNLPSSADPHDYNYEETVRAENMDRTVLDPIPDRYSPDMEAQRIFDKMFDVDSKKSYIIDSPRCGYDIDASDCDDKAYHQVVHKKDGSSQRQHRLTHVSAAALRHKYAILEHELRLQKSLSEECEDLGVDSPSASELFPEAELLFAASPAQDHNQDQMQHSNTPQPILNHSCIPQPDIDDQIATDQLLPRGDVHDRPGLNLGLDDVGIVTVSEDGMQATIALDQEEFARSHPNTTFHSEPTDDAVVQPFTIAGLKSRHITSTIFHSNHPQGTVLMTAPQTTVISQAAGEGTSAQSAVKYSDIENMIDSLPATHGNNINISSVLVKDDGLTRFDNMLNDSRELHLSNTASAIVHSAGNATQVIRRVCYGAGKSERDARFLMDEPDALIAGDDAKMIVEDSSRDATLESMAEDVDDDRSSPERHAELFWESNSASERSESRRPLDFSSDSDKCCKSPSFDETNSTDSSGVGAHMRLDSVIKEARGIERSGSADGSSADDTHPPLRTYPPKRTYHSIEGELERSMSGKTRAGERSPDSLEVRRRASGRGVVKRGCHCCNGSPTPSRPKKSRQRKPTIDFTTNN